ncbi:rhodanese-like domain-containing protein [bacterium]|nr:rhodanese-like domain-containing protein [bacterium]
MKDVNALEALEIMQKDPNVIYLDVRSVPEFEQGHPERARNIPLLDLVPGMGMVANPDFTNVVEANIPKDAAILVGCKSGGRSARAIEIMAQMGYQNLTNVRTGFVGSMDMTGRITEPGWSMLNLPQCKACEDSSSYENLRASAVNKLR